MRFIIIIFLLVLSSILNVANAVIIENVNVINNKRISKETILTYGQIEIKKDYNDDQINQILKNLYDTNFFENI
jgi:outer membrane protein insertion porin family